MRMLSTLRRALDPGGTYVACLLVPVVFSVICFKYDVHLDTGITSFRARDESTATKQDALLATLKAEHPRPKPKVIQPEVPHNAPVTVSYAQQSVDSFWLTLVYETKPPGGDILQMEHLEAMREVERRVASMPNYQDFCSLDQFDRCKPPLSLLSLQDALQEELHSSPNSTNAALIRAAMLASNVDPSTEVSPAALLALARNAPALSSVFGNRRLFQSGHQVTWFYDQAFLDGTSSTCVALRSAFVFALPLEGYSTPWDRVDVQTNAYKDFVTKYTPLLERSGGVHTRVLHAGGQITEAEVRSIVLSDLGFCAASLLAVFLVLWLHTQSLWVTCNAIVGLMLSFPMSYFVYRVIFGIKYLTFMAALVPFVVLGVGCDDILVFYDTWRQQGAASADMNDWAVFKKAYTTAAKAMFATSFTTAAAFLANMVSYMPPTRMLGLFAALAVVSNYVIVMTLVPAALRLSQYPWKCKQVQYSTLVDEDADVGAPEHDKATMHLPQKLHGLCAAKHQCLQWTERFFRDVFAPALYRLRAAVLVAFTVVGGCSLFLVCARLQLADSVPSILPPGHNLQRVDFLLRSVFTSQLWSEIYVIWGVQGIERTVVDPNDFTKLGVPIFKEDFDMEAPSTQKLILHTCQRVQDHRSTLKLTLDAGSQNCLMQEFATFRRRQSLEFPLATNFTAEFLEWLYQNLDSRDFSAFADMTVIDEHGTIRSFVARYFVDMSPLDASMHELRALKDAWEETVIGYANRQPGADVATAFQASSLWLRIGLENSVVHSAMIAPGISMAAALVAVLVTTRSIKAAVIATLTIGQVIVVMLAFLIAAGWKFGIIESLCVSILIGTSVDYCIHMAISYVESPSYCGQDRLRDALGRTGVTITAAAATTIISSSMLFLCEITIFNQVALVMLVNTTCGYILSLIFFGAAMSIFDPVHPGQATDSQLRANDSGIASALSLEASGALPSLLVEASVHESHVCNGVGTDSISVEMSDYR